MCVCVCGRDGVEITVIPAVLATEERRRLRRWPGVSTGRISPRIVGMRCNLIGVKLEESARMLCTVGRI